MEKNESKTPKVNSNTNSNIKKPAVNATKSPAAPGKLGVSKTAAPTTPKKTTTNKSSSAASNKPITSTKVPVEQVKTNAKPSAVASKIPSSSKSTSKPSITDKKPIPTNTTKKPTKTNPSSIVPFAKSKNTVTGKPQVHEIDQDEIDKELIVEDNEEEKKKKKKFILIIFFIILGLALLGVGIYFITRIPKSDIKFSVVIDAEVETSFENEFGQIEHIKYYPGDTISGELTITVDDLNSTIPTSDNVFLRFKIGVEIDNNYYAGFFEPIFNRPSDWYGNGADDSLSSSSNSNLEYSADNYYYYCFRCADNTKLTVFNTLYFKEDADHNVLNGKNGKLIFTVEILEGNFSAISQQWHTAPDEWRTIVR